MVPSFRLNTSTCWACRCCADAFSATRTLKIRPRLQSSIRPRLAPTGQTQTRLENRSCLGLDSREPLSSAKPAWTIIVGVIADARTESLADLAIPQIYRSVYQHPTKDLTIFLRGQLDPSSISAQVREQVQSIDPELPVFHAETLDDVLCTSLSVRRFSMEMVAFFAATALL